MSRWARWLSRRKRMMADLDQDIRDYIARETQDNIGRGLPPEEARYAALRKFGNLTQVKEETWEVWSLVWLEQLWQDVLFGLRRLAKNPGFTAVAVLTLALGIGANAAVFTLTYAVILKSLPVPHPEQLVRYTFRNGSQDLGLSGPLYDALSKQESAVTGLLAWSGTKLAVRENGGVKSVDGAMMTGDGFQVLGLRPARGQTFSAQDDVPSGGPNGYQALLGYNYWQDHFQGASSVLGQTLAINGRDVTIIGVLPKGFDGLVTGFRTDILLPLAFEEIVNSPDPRRHEAGNFWLTVMGRLKRGESLRTARAGLRTTEAAVRNEADPKHRFLSGFFAPFKLGVEGGSSGRSLLRVAYESPLVVLEILVGLLLLLCCANVALLILAHVSGRQPELAVRLALGAPRVRLFRLVLSEVLLLAACGLGAGIGVGWWAAKSLVAMLAAIGEPPPIDVTPRAAILAFTAGLTVFSLVAAGAWPALSATRTVLQPSLTNVHSSAALKLRGGWFVPVQVAVSVVLLACATLLGGTLLHFWFEDSGFRAAGVVMAEVDLSAAQPTPARAAQDVWQILESVEHAPGVESAALMSMPPLENGWSSAHYFSVDRRGGVHSDMQTWFEAVSLGYFATMGTPIEQGRAFSRSDLSGLPVCILSASAARYFFSSEDPIGEFLYAGGGDPGLDDKTKVDPKNACAVIGVAQDARFRSLHEAPPRMVYTPLRPDDLGSVFAVRARRSGDAASALRLATHRIVPAAAEPAIYTFSELVDQHLRSERMLTALSSSFAGVALLLTALGLYGLLARGVSMRTKEIGIRLALGARPPDMLAMVIRQGLRLVLVGAAVGLAVSLEAPRVLRALLFGVKPPDALIMLGVVAVLLMVVFPACYLPARRATKVDPMVALRYE